MFDLTGKVALVTGATGAIGREIAKTLHMCGASIALSGTRIEALEELSNELSTRVSLFSCNLSIPEAVEELIPNVQRVMNKVDILVNNAGINRDGLLMRISDEDWEDVFKINLEAPFRLMRSAVKGMIKSKWGRIINISSIVGAIGNPGQANYAATKSGLFGLSKTAAAEFASRGITVNCVAPGFIESTMTDKISDQHKQKLQSSIPIGRVGTPAEVAAAVTFLSSQEASYITGHVLHVNGGMAMI